MVRTKKKKKAIVTVKGGDVCLPQPDPLECLGKAENLVNVTERRGGGLSDHV